MKLVSGMLIRIFATHENSKSAMKMPVLLTVKTETQRENIICFKYILACREVECVWKVITGISSCCFLRCVYVELAEPHDEAQNELVT